MADPERMMMMGKLQECLEDMKKADAHFRNACATLRQRALMFENPGMVDISLINAAVDDLAEAKTEWLDARATAASLREGLGIK